MPDPSSQSLPQSPREFFAKYRGQVVDNVDPLGKGRLKVIVPQVLDRAEVWALPSVPYAGPNLGFFALPENETGIWVEFEAGDPSYPIWTGCFWADGDIASGDAVPSVKFFKTNKFTLRIDDENGEIVIKNDSGSEITLTAEEILHKSAAVKQEASGGKKTELSAASYNVNDGALEVL